MRIGEKDTTIMHIYKCSGCGGYYGKSTAQIQSSCTVLHSPGSCCHYGETEYTGDKIEITIPPIGEDD